MFFAYHHGDRVLVFPHPQDGKPCGIKLGDLLSFPDPKTGKPFWNVTDAGLRASLPRFGKPAISVEPASKLQAMDLVMRHGS